MRKLLLKLYRLLLKIIHKFGPKTIFMYLVVGVLSAGVNFLTFALLWDVFHVPYKIGVTIAYFLSVVFNFTSSRHVTFKGADGHILAHLYKYLTMIGINYLITLSVVHYVVEALHLTPYIGIFLAIVITAGTGLCLSKFRVFRELAME